MDNAQSLFFFTSRHWFVAQKNSSDSDRSEINPDGFKIRELALRTFSYLDTGSLCVSTQVCTSWNIVLSDDDHVWQATASSVAECLGCQYDPTKDCLKFFKSQIQKMQENKSKFYASINGLYGINLNEKKIDGFLKDLKKSSILAKNYLSPAKDMALSEEGDDPIEFTYAEGFEYVIRKINYLINKKDHALLKKEEDIIVGVSVRDPRVFALINLEHCRVQDLLLKFRDKKIVNWFMMICQVLQEKKMIKNIRQLPGENFLMYEIHV